MPIYATVGSSFTPAPEGGHTAVCCDIIDLGMVEVAYNGKKKSSHKVRIVWQIDEPRDDGKRFTVNRRYTLSLHEKSSLRRDLESWRGRKFNDEELKRFDLEALLSVPCMLNVIHETREGSTYANVASIMRLPKGVPAIAVQEYVRVQDRPPKESEAKHDESATVDPPDFGSRQDFGITDDDIPF